MSFFDSIPQPPPPQPPPRMPRPAWERPETVIPGSVRADLVLIRTEQVAVAIGSLRAYPSGFEFTVHVRVRRADDTGGPGVAHPFEWYRYGRGELAPEDVLRLGVLYADGRRTATTAGHPLRFDDAGDDRLVLHRGGGGGNEHGWDNDFWVYPLPPDGPVTLVASWLEHGVAEARAELDGSAIREAATRALILWPDERDLESGAGYRIHRVTGYSSAEPDADG
jgi:hypothetical protein